MIRQHQSECLKAFPLPFLDAVLGYSFCAIENACIVAWKLKTEKRGWGKTADESLKIFFKLIDLMVLKTTLNVLIKIKISPRLREIICFLVYVFMLSQPKDLLF